MHSISSDGPASGYAHRHRPGCDTRIHRRRLRAPRLAPCRHRRQIRWQRVLASDQRPRRLSECWRGALSPLCRNRSDARCAGSASPSCSTWAPNWASVRPTEARGIELALPVAE